ncbi:glycerophosphoryl diester phosphodiesterase membrane domain-containing protein [Leucobacter massiliensis]|uniref:GP-PDE domain-containing protein n=1 Tax=Leucobacter massiliensis TaxID=1686285 RepID=A0A2S9QNX5_9MICO|nr:glycerophosphoryl diester phosphodiesterase membrane domain-containing protein [Leucobacter massiliensis]PRI11285.1 hypothetical protein B4915_10610 [Leucobacter massiliensis]
MPTATTGVPRPGIWCEYRELLRESRRLARAGGSRLLALAVLGQLLVLLVAQPVLGWLFREALRAGGMTGLDLGQLRLGGAWPLTAVLIVLIVVLAFWLLALQFTAVVVLLHRPGLSLRGLLGEFGRVSRKLLRPSSAPLLLYLFLLLPLTGFGFTSALTQRIAIPAFITGELLKSTSGGVGLLLFLLVLLLLNVRLSLTVPVFVLTDGRGAARSSWRLTRGLRASVPLVLAIATVIVLAGVAAAALILVSAMPTVLTDLVAPSASPLVAAFSLGAAQAAALLLGACTTVLLGGVLIAHVLRGRDRLTPSTVFATDALPGAAPRLGAEPGAPSPRPSRRRRLVLAAGLLVLALGFGGAATGTMQRLSDAPGTLVLGHRGFSQGGVENTLGGLEAAAAAGADLVEMDVMQTADGGFVAMHDATLGRLADRPDAVKDLSVEQLTALTVHDLQGHEGRIPALADYVTRAAELGMPLLIEIKLGGGETPDHVERLVAELERLDALESNIYHSLDAASVARLKQLRPDLTVGYTMAFAGGGVPETPADFIVVEQWSATRSMLDGARAAGLGFMAWTVNDAAGISEQLRMGADGVITDHPDEALALRGQIAREDGLSGVLIDALTRFVTIP